MKSLFHDKIKLLSIYILALAGSAFAVFFAPIFMQQSPEIKNVPFEILYSLLLYAVVKVIVTTVLICREKSSQTVKANVAKALLQSIVLEGFLGLIEAVFFVIIEFIVRLFYNKAIYNTDYTNFKMTFSVVIVIILVAVLPNYLALFWSVIKNSNKGFEKYKSGLVLSLDTYSLLFFVVIMMFVAAYIIRTVFLLVPDETVADIVKMLLLSLVIMLSLSLTYSIFLSDEQKKQADIKVDNCNKI